VGARLIRDALGRAEEAGEPAVMVEGIPAYYPRFGFEHASALGFISPHPKIPVDAFMVKRLPGYSPDLAGRIVYPAAFDALGYSRPVLEEPARSARRNVLNEVREGRL
jgi:putative acetyltransferase